MVQDINTKNRTATRTPNLEKSTYKRKFVHLYSAYNLVNS